ncbi:MAG: amidohydrolase family protein [Deltaproteobacteria bacterium]|nr:amidohydrolase family protein [Deltaproteobacteria bacterium]MBW2499791.1 amidohydrolase family protein [Deltaproteobacteria bacterium]
MSAGRFDLVVRGGRLVDGSGVQARRADVAIRGRQIAAIFEGEAPSGEAVRELDASGCVVAPGFIDAHTHLDAQLCWDATGSPSNRHGVTTVVLGLCGFGVAPCPVGGGDYLLRSLEVVEEIPFACTSQGVPFEWSSFADYLDYLAGLSLSINAAAFVPHSALRFFVMGERARGERADASDRAALVEALEASLAAGAIGFASSRGPNHQDAFGDPVPSRHADDEELRALVGACAGRPWQINAETKFGPDAAPLLAEIQRYEEWTRAAGARFSWTPFTAEPGEEAWREILAHTREVNASGLEVAPQVIAQPISVALRFDRPSVLAIVDGWGEPLRGYANLSHEEKRARLSDSRVREAMRAAPSDRRLRFAPDYPAWILSTSATRPELVGRSLAEIAAAEDVHPADLLCDLALADDLATQIQMPVSNRSEEGMRALVTDPHTLLGLGDAGAHVTSVHNYNNPTQLLAERVRDQGWLSLEQAVHRLTAQPARFLGLPDRGVVQVGAAADLTIFDLEALALERAELRADLPGGGERLYQAARGYRATIVGGEIALLDDAVVEGVASGCIVRAREIQAS